MKTAVSTYAFINAKLRGRLSRLIPHDSLMQIVAAQSLEEAVHLLAPTVFAPAVDVYEETGDLLLTELAIERVYRESLQDISRYVAQFTDPPITAFVSALLLRFELASVKNAVRLWFERVFRKRLIEDKIPYLLRSDPGNRKTALPLDALVNAPDSGALSSLVGGKPYSSAFASAISSVDEDRSLFRFEVAIDRWYYQNLASAAKSLNQRDQAIAERLIGIEIDVINVNWIVRMQTYYREGTAGSSAQLLSGGAITDRKTLDETMQSQKPAQFLAELLGKRIGSSFSAQPEATAGREERSDATTRTLAFLETLLQQLLVYESRRALGGYPFSIGVVLAYVSLSQQEARAITTILNGKYYDLSHERIGALL